MLKALRVSLKKGLGEREHEGACVCERGQRVRCVVVCMEWGQIQKSTHNKFVGGKKDVFIVVPHFYKMAF